MNRYDLDFSHQLQDLSDLTQRSTHGFQLISEDFREISQHLNLSSCESHLFELFLHQNPSQFSTQTLTHPASQCLAGLATHLGDLLGNAEP